jgi:hypothetical protein
MLKHIESRISRYFEESFANISETGEPPVPEYLTKFVRNHNPILSFTILCVVVFGLSWVLCSGVWYFALFMPDILFWPAVILLGALFF